MTYKHLTDGERETLDYLRACGKSIREVAFYLNRAPSTIARELKRNQPHWRYKCHLAQQLAVQRRHKTVRRPHRFQIEPELLRSVVSCLKLGWSPEIIAGRFKRESGGKTVIHHETIYRWIYHHDRSLVRHLVRAHSHRRFRHQRRWPSRIIPRRISIRQRPNFINLRQRPGDWESDLLWGAGRCALQVLVERQTRYVIIRKLRNKTAQANYEALTSALSSIQPALRKSITYDNGGENMLHLEINKFFKLESFFCEPFHAWEKGTVENTNGLIRRHYPKRTNFDTIPPSHFRQTQSWLNNRPRKCLAFQTSGEAYNSAQCCT